METQMTPPINHSDVADLAGTTPTIDWASERQGFSDLLAGVFSNLGVQYFDPTPKFKTVFDKQTKKSTQVPDGFTPAKPTQLLSLETGKVLANPSTGTNYVWASDPGNIIPDFTFESLAGLKEGYLTNGIKVSYDVIGTGAKAYAVVYAIDIAFYPQNDAPYSGGLTTFASTRFVSDDGIRINTAAGAGQIPGKSAAVSGKFDRVEEVWLDVNPDSSIVTVQANRVDLEGLGFKVASGSPVKSGEVTGMVEGQDAPVLSGWFNTPAYSRSAGIDSDSLKSDGSLAAAQLRSLLGAPQGEIQTLTFTGSLTDVPEMFSVGALQIYLDPLADGYENTAQGYAKQAYDKIHNNLEFESKMGGDPAGRTIPGLIAVDYSPNNGTQLTLRFDPSMGDATLPFERHESPSGSFTILAASTREGVGTYSELTGDSDYDDPSTIIFASNYDGTVDGTAFNDNIALNKSGTFVNLYQGPNGGEDDSDTLFFNLDPLRRNDLTNQESPASFELTQKGSYEVVGFGKHDRLVIGLRALDESGSLVALEKIVSAGELVWLELTDAGKALAERGLIEASQLLIEMKGLESALGGDPILVDSPFIVFSVEQNIDDPMQEERLNFSRVENSGGPAESLQLDTQTFYGDLLNDEGRLEIDQGQGPILVGSSAISRNEDGVRALKLDVSAVNDLSAQWNSSGILSFFAPEENEGRGELQAEFFAPQNFSSDPMLLIMRNAVDRLGIYDGQSELNVNLITPELTPSGAKFIGTNSDDFFIPVEGLRSEIRGDGGNDIVVIGNMIGSIASGGAGFNQMDAPDAAFEAVKARALTLDYSDIGKPLFANLDLGITTFEGGTDWIEGAWSNIIGTTADDTIIGSELGNELYGAGGDDRLYGRQQRDESIVLPEFSDSYATSESYWWDTTDYVFGGTGNDTYFVDLNQFSKIAAHEFAGEGDNDILQINGIGAGLWDLTSIVASAGGYEYRQNASGTELGYTEATSLLNMKTDVEFVSLTRNIEKISISGSSDFRTSQVFTFDVGYGNGSSAGNGSQLVLPNSQGTHLMNGGGGDDIIVASEGRNVYLGGQGNDIIFAMGGQHRVMAGAGDDMVWVKPQAERSLIHLSQGKDALVVDVDDLLSGRSETSEGYFFVDNYSRSVYNESQYGSYENTHESLRGLDSSFETVDLFTVGLEQEPLVTSAGSEKIPYFQNVGGDHQFGRMMASLSEPLLEEFVLDIYDDWYYSGGLFGDLGGDGHSTVLDFRVDEDTLLLAATGFFIDGPDYLSMTFTDGDDVIVSRFFEKQDLIGNGSAAAGVIHFDKDAGMVGGTVLSGFVDVYHNGFDGDAIYARSGDLVQLLGMQGATKPAVEMMFENAGFLGYQEVTRESFLIGLPAIDEAGMPFYDSYA